MNETAIGVLGCGEWGRHVVRDLVSLGCRVTVADPEESGRARARALGAAAVATPRELPEVAGFVVVTPSSTHAALVEDLLERGVPIFVEKPFTTDAASARRIAERAPERVFLMHKWRYHEGIEELARIAARREKGPVLGLEVTFVGPGNTQRDIDTVWTLAPHALSIALAVLGGVPEPRSAVADTPGGGSFATGLTALLGAEPWVKIELSSRTPTKLRRFRLLCRDGAAEVIDGAEPLREQPLLRELREFVEHLRGGPKPRCSAAEGLLVVEGIERLRALAGLR